MADENENAKVRRLRQQDNRRFGVEDFRFPVKFKCGHKASRGTPKRERCFECQLAHLPATATTCDDANEHAVCVGCHGVMDSLGDEYCKACQLDLSLAILRSEPASRRNMPERTEMPAVAERFVNRGSSYVRIGGVHRRLF